jgi:hypothetical protein
MPKATYQKQHAKSNIPKVTCQKQHTKSNMPKATRQKQYANQRSNSCSTSLFKTIYNYSNDCLKMKIFTCGEYS